MTLKRACSPVGALLLASLIPGCDLALPAEPAPVAAAAQTSPAPAEATLPTAATEQEPANLDALIAALSAEADRAADLPNLRADYGQLVAAHTLPDTPEGRLAYTRVKLAFEATRDGGWWWVHWTITNREPNSDAVWAAWASAAHKGEGGSTADAECDELSALFAFLARRLGVKEVGLLWPTSNHTVAAWRPTSTTGAEVRIVVPTSQIFLGPEDRLDTPEFDPWRQRHIYDYGRADAPGSARLASGLSGFFLQQVRDQLGVSEAALQVLRNLRAAVMNGALTGDEAAAIATREAETWTASADPSADQAALRGLGAEITARQ